MIRRPPRSTRTDTLFPYTTLFRSRRIGMTLDLDPILQVAQQPDQGEQRLPALRRRLGTVRREQELRRKRQDDLRPVLANDGAGEQLLAGNLLAQQGAEIAKIKIGRRRGGKECVSTCRSQWSPYH